LWGADTVDTDGFGPSELHALAIIAAGGERVAASLSDLAMLCASTPLLLLDRINERALASPYGDIVVDVAGSPPALIVDACSYVEKLLARVQPLIKTLGVDETADANGAQQHVLLAQTED